MEEDDRLIFFARFVILAFVGLHRVQVYLFCFALPGFALLGFAFVFFVCISLVR